MTVKRTIKGTAAVLGSATCFAFMSVLIKTAYQAGLSPLQVMTLQSGLAAVLLFAYAAIFDHRLFVVPLRSLPVLAVQGLVGSLGTSLLYAFALLYLPVSVAILLLYLYPAMVVGTGAIIFHRKIGLFQLGALALTLLGTVLASGVIAGVGNLPLIGVGLGIAAALAYTIFNLLGEVAVHQVSPLAAMCFAQWFSTLGLLIYQRGAILALPWNAEVAGIGLALATIASIIPFYLMLQGIQWIGADKASILSTFELPMTFLFAAVFIDETPTWNQWAGGILVLGGIILLNWRGRNVKQRVHS